MYIVPLFRLVYTNVQWEHSSDGVMLVQSVNAVPGVSAKFAQIGAIRRAASSDTVSYFFYMINIATR